MHLAPVLLSHNIVKVLKKMKRIFEYILFLLLPLRIFLILTVVASVAQQSKLSQLPLFPYFKPTIFNGLAPTTAPLPTMVIQAWKQGSDQDTTTSTEPFTKVISGSDNDPMEIHRDHGSDEADLKVTCFASYPLVFKTNIIANKILQSYQVSADASNWTYVITFSAPSAGFVSCSSLMMNSNPNDTQLVTSVQIYFDSVPEDRDECTFCGAFVPPEHLKLIPLEGGSASTGDGKSLRYLAPCRLNTLVDSDTLITLKPKLLVGDTELSEGLSTWDPAEGFSFTLPASHSQTHDGTRAVAFGSFNSERVNVSCVLQEQGQKMTFSLPQHFEKFSIPTIEAEGDKLWISRESVVAYEGNVRQSLEFKPRINFCQWFSSCSLRRQEVKVKKTEQGSSLGTVGTKPTVVQGVVSLAGLQIPLPSDYNFTLFFTGLDSNLYLMPGGVKPPDEALIQLVGIPTEQIYKNDTPVLSLTCRVVNFLMAPRLYLKSVRKNGSSTVLTAGKTLTDDVNGLKNGISEFIFNLELDVDMRTVECLGLDLLYPSGGAHGKWRSASFAINVSYSYAPTVKPGTPKSGDKKCLKHGNCLLDCPITGAPLPKISWTIPGEVTPTQRPNPLHLDKIGNAAIIPGRYTCFASSTNGRANYTYNVELEESGLGTGPNIGIVVVVIILVLLTTTFAWKYHSTKKLLGGLKPEQIQEFLKGNQDAADKSEDGAERARLMEFAKFISPQLLHINMSEKLGEGCYGIVYGGSYDSQPAAIKTFKMGVTHEQIYSVLVEIKLMAFIGDHENIVKFFGADISRLRSGQMYMVMERSTGGSLESYLRKELRGKLSLIKQSRCFVPGVDELLQTLAQFCFDIASAMEFLEAKRIIHGDLATRNVLLFGENSAGIVAKLTDFGFSRRLNGSSQYTSRSFGQVRLPWAWGSPELLTCGTYSTASDVWAFGVTLWEIFSLGRAPFQGCTFNQEFIEALQNGRMLPKPELASDEVFQVFLSCWNLHPSDRPTFGQLCSHFAGLKLTHKHIPELFSIGMDSVREMARGEETPGNGSAGLAAFANGNVYM